jgi:hypothetical protein
MFDQMMKIAWYSWPLVAGAVFASTMWRLRTTRVRSRIGAALSFAAAAALAMVLLTLSAVFRDGLGPDSVPSTGVTALRRTAECLPFLLLVAPLLAAGWWASKVPRDAEKNAG